MSDTLEVTCTVTKEYDLQEIWGALVSADFMGCQDFSLQLECDWGNPWSDISITFYREDLPLKNGVYQTEDKILTKEEILRGFTLAVQSNATHCGKHRIDDLEDPDACFAHQVLQYALYGDITFG